MGEGKDRIRRRLVLFVHGLDPRGPAVFHRFQTEAASEDASRHGREIAVGRRERDADGHAWTIDARWPGEEPVRTRFVGLGWHDLIRARWERGLWRQFLGVVGWFSRLLRSGALARGGRRKSMVLAFLALPATILVFVLVLAGVIALAAVLIGALAKAAGLTPWLGLAALALAFAGPPLWRWLDARLNLCWLGQGYRYLVDLSRDQVAGLDARIDGWAGRLVREAASDWDEILVVGHSVGAANAAIMIGRALETNPRLGREGAPVSYLTLGHNLTGYELMGLTPRHAADMDRLVAADWIGWADVTMPSDPAASAWPPLSFTNPGSGRVKSRSPRFHLGRDADAYRALRGDSLRLHYHYMGASDDPALHDWFALIAGSEPSRS